MVLWRDPFEGGIKRVWELTPTDEVAVLAGNWRWLEGTESLTAWKEMIEALADVSSKTSWKNTLVGKKSLKEEIKKAIRQLHPA